MIRKPRINRNGYWAVRIDGKYILEHRHVMEVHLGRKLLSTEAVHHINHDTRDNRVENLEVCITHGQHTKIHHPEIAEKHRITFKGKHHSPKTEFKKGDARLLGNKFREGIPSWNKGRAWNEEERKMLSKAHQGKHQANKGSFAPGFTPWNKGLKKK